MSHPPAASPALHLPPSRRGRPGDDLIFALNAEATARRQRGESIVNATVGALLDDAGALAILPTAARAIREVPATEWAPYAPIAGSPAFLDAVLADVFARRPDLKAQAFAVATPGGSGALRHAMATFLEPGQAILTASFHWGPYRTIAEEQDRRVEVYAEFGPAGTLDPSGLDRALGAQIARQGRALVVVNDPCQNPTGYSMTEAEWGAVAEILGRHGRAAPVTVLLDSAYAAYAPHGDVFRGMAALEGIADRVLVALAWSASKTFTHYGLRVGALVVLAPDAAERADIKATLAFASRGTWSNCNRGGMAAIARLLTDPALREAAAQERKALEGLLAERAAAFNAAARAAGLRHPRYDGGFFVTVFAPDGARAAERMRGDGVYAVPQDGGLRLGLCSVAKKDVDRLVASVAKALRP